MLEQWKVSNFKSIRNETTVELSALTVFAGANSSGKSTLLQSILLTAQTLGNPVTSRQVVLNGRILRLGTMSDLRSYRSPDESQLSTITIGFKYSYIWPSFWVKHLEGVEHSPIGAPDEPLQSVTCEYTFSSNAALASELGDLQPTVLSCTLSATYDLDTEPIISTTTIRRATTLPEQRAKTLELNYEALTREEKESLAYEVNGDDYRLLPFRRRYISYEYIDGPVAGATLNHFLPSALRYCYDTVAAKAASIADALIRRTQRYRSHSDIPLNHQTVALIVSCVHEYLSRQPLPSFAAMRKSRIEAAIRNFEATPSMTSALELLEIAGPQIKEMLTAYRTQLVEAVRDGQRAVYSTVPVAVEASTAIRSVVLEKLRYLGPLRDEPKQFYALEGVADPTDVGFRGEYTAAVLASNRDITVSYISSAEWLAQGASASSSVVPLHEAVEDWLSYFEVVNKLAAQDKGVFGHDLRVSVESRDTLHSLVHVGVGVSQVLPIVVMALIAPAESILIFEQPELHLHPLVQTRLGDFLLSVAVSGKQCLVETHSEYLINRLRLRSAEDINDVMSNVFSLYYVSKRMGATQYQRIEVNEYGAVPEWPEGFFDQSPREAENILRAAVKKRNRRRQGNNG